MGSKINYIFRQCLVIIISILAYVSFPLIVLTIPVYSLRLIVMLLAKVFRRGLGKMLTPRSSLFAAEFSEMFKSRTRCTVYVSFLIDINVDLETFNKFYLDNVVMRKQKGSDELQNPEFQQTITSWLGYLFWKWDKDFAMENHVHLYQGPGKVDGMTEEDLPHVAKELSSRPFPPGRSPWDIWVWDNARLEGDPEDKRKTLYFLRVHHSLGDGLSILRFLVEDIHGTDVPTKVFEVGTKKTEKQLSGWNLIRTLMKAPYEMVSVLIHSWDFNEWRLPERKLTGKLNAGLTRCVPVERMKEIKRAYGTSYTAVIFAAFAGGIRTFMIEKNLRVPEKIHCVIPLPMPGHPNKLRNHVTAVIAPLPVGITNPRDRILCADKTLHDIRKSSVPLATFLSLPLLGGLPIFAVKILATNKIATSLMSIIPGPPFMANLMGHNVDRIMFGGGLLMGNIGLGLSSLSYNGYNRFGVGFDDGVYPDPADTIRLVELIEAELDTLSRDEII